MVPMLGSTCKPQERAYLKNAAMMLGRCVMAVLRVLCPLGLASGPFGPMPVVRTVKGSGPIRSNLDMLGWLSIQLTR